ncbi:hypothetical protein MTO96_008294 [Rhipicephalus appendiculatus]
MAAALGLDGRPRAPRHMHTVATAAHCCRRATPLNTTTARVRRRGDTLLLLLGGHDCCCDATRPHTVDAVVQQRRSAHSKTPTGASAETPLAPASPPRPRRAVAPPSATARSGAEVKAPFSAAAPPPRPGSEFGLRAGLASSSPAALSTLLQGRTPRSPRKKAGRTARTTTHPVLELLVKKRGASANARVSSAV